MYNNNYKNSNNNNNNNNNNNAVCFANYFWHQLTANFFQVIVSSSCN